MGAPFGSTHMLRSLALALCACAVLFSGFSATIARASVHDVAPADEYFGPFKESILGIRNHLVSFENKADTELLFADSIKGIDNIEIAIEDWHVHYPRDPWLPKFLNRVVHVYARAHALSDSCAHRALAILEHDYARSAEARDAETAARAPR